MPSKIADGFALMALTAQPALWVSQVNEVLQLAGTVIGLIAGVYAIIWYRVRIAESKRKQSNEQSKRRDSE